MKIKNKKSFFLKNKYFFLGAVFVCGLGFLNFFFDKPEMSFPHSNLIDTQISVFSDQNINLSAIETNLEFKDIAFAPVKSSKSYLFQNQIAAVAKAIRLFTIKSLIGKENGMWIWTPIAGQSGEYMDSIIAGAKNNGVNVIYLSIDSYLDIFVMPKSEERERQKAAFEQKIEDFISKAEAQNIEVDAEAGWRNWAQKNNTYKAFAVANFVKNFNESHEYKFRGFQYDVEPYLLPEYKKDPVPVLKDFLTLVEETGQFFEGSDLKFSVVIPDFYDSKDEMTPEFVYNDKKDSVFGHLLRILDEQPNNSIIVMSYRAFAQGFDGSIEISSNEMQTAKKSSYRTKIIIAQETGDVEPNYITFHRTSKNYLFREIGKIDTAFGSHPNYGGIAIHYANTFLALK